MCGPVNPRNFSAGIYHQQGTHHGCKEGNGSGTTASDNDFRRLLKKDAHAALVTAGYKPPAGTDAAKAAAVSGAACLQLKASDRIAPKSKIVRDRAKLEATTTAVMRFMGSSQFKAD